jgi:membrane-bound metal-dependent hydrolase YbcI (DUF457 family)
MPFTPFHFGLGLAAKAALPRQFYLTYFVALQVAIDLESLHNLTYRRHPVHGFLHTFLGATLVALLASAVAVPLVRRWQAAPQPLSRTSGKVLGTALFATWSHVAFDAVMHSDMQPFWPLTSSNPLLCVISVGALHVVCLVLGFFGIVLLAFAATLRDDAT